MVYAINFMGHKPINFMGASQVAHPMIWGLPFRDSSLFPHPGVGSRDEFLGFKVCFQSWFMYTALEATQGQNDSLFSQLPYKRYLEEVASVGD